MEIVTEPDFSSAEEAAAFVQELHLILKRIGTCSCKMEGESDVRFCLVPSRLSEIRRTVGHVL